MAYTLNRKLTNNKAGRFHYQVTDQSGNVISERRSNREYIACTIEGRFYFSRLDLIGKGDHGRAIKSGAVYAIAYLDNSAIDILD